MSLSFLRLDKRISHNALVKLASELVARAASFALVLLAARRLGEAGFGWYNYGLALGFVVAQLADFGLQLLLVREIASQGRAARPLVQAAFRLKLLLSIPVVVLLWLLTPEAGGSVRWALFGLGLVMLGQTYLEFAAHIFRGQQDLLTEAYILAGARLLAAGLGALVLLAGGGLLALAVSGIVSVTLLIGWALRLLRRTGWLAAGTAWLPGRRADAAGPARTIYRTLLREAFPLGISIFLSIAYTRLAVLLLQARQSELAVATFSAAHRLVEPSQLIPAALLAAVYPAYSLALSGDRGRARRLGRRTSIILAVIGASAALTLWLLAGWLVPFLYGPSYADSVGILRVLGLSIFPAFVNYSLTHYLIARGQQGMLVVFTAIMLAVHAVLSWLWVPRWGPLGPAVSIVIAESILLVCCLLALALTQPQGRHGPEKDTHVVASPESAGAGAAGTAPPV